MYIALSHLIQSAGFRQQTIYATVTSDVLENKIQTLEFRMRKAALKGSKACRRLSITRVWLCSETKYKVRVDLRLQVAGECHPTITSYNWFCHAISVTNAQVNIKVDYCNNCIYNNCSNLSIPFEISMKIQSLVGYVQQEEKYLTLVHAKDGTMYSDLKKLRVVYNFENDYIE